MSEKQIISNHFIDNFIYNSRQSITETALGEVVEYSGEPPIPTMPVSGIKHDADKTDLSLLPRVSLEQEARALQFGVQKYGRYNYVKGFESSRLIAACLRHVVAWQDGEDKDPESGVSHLGHAKACLSMLLHLEQLGNLQDNRLKR